MSRPDDGLIHAWLDGELDAVEAARVAKLVETDAEWGAAAAEARGLIAASSRIVKSLDVVPAGVIPSGSKASGARPRRVVVRPWLRVAATVALVAGVGYAANESRLTDVVEQDAPMASPAAMSDEQGRTSVAQTPAPTVAPPSSPPMSPAAEREERDDGGGAGLSARLGAGNERREIAKAAVASTDSITAAVGATRANVGEVASERMRDSRLMVRQDSASTPTTTLATESRAIAAPPAAAPVAAGAGARAAGAAAATEQAKLSARAQVPPAQEPTATLRPRQIIDREPSAPSAFAANDAMTERVLTGCWRTQGTAPADSILVDPRILSVAGDSLVIVLNRAALDLRALSREALPRAIVVRVGTSTLRGTARDANGAVVPFSATRTSCP